jgi:hypothetical protein
MVANATKIKMLVRIGLLGSSSGFAGLSTDSGSGRMPRPKPPFMFDLNCTATNEKFQNSAKTAKGP